MKKLLGIDIPGSIIFAPGAANVGTLTFVGRTFSLNQILVITNVTRNTIIYNFADPLNGAFSFSNNVLTLDANTSTHSSGDVLQAFVDVADGQAVTEVGELLEAINAMRIAIAALTQSIGFALPNAQGQPIMEVRQATAANLNATVSGTVTANIGTGTLSALTTLTNQAQIGGYSANDQIPTLLQLQADNLRRNIQVT